MKKKEIIILHDYGVRDHYTAIYSLASEYSIVEKEFTIFPLLLKSLLKRDSNKLKKACSNLLWLSKSLINPAVNKDKNIIIGIAPFDWRLLYLRRAIKEANIILHTSWISWNDDFHPRKNLIFSKYIKGIWKKFVIDIEHIAAVTRKTKNEVKKFAGLNDSYEKISCVYHSIHDIKSSLDFNHEKSKMKVLFVGNIIEQKGILKILEVASMQPKISFTFVGKGDLSRELNNRHNVKYLGYISNKQELYDIYSQHDVILLPSLRKGKWEELFGISLIEAMSHKCIPITTDHSGPLEIIDDSDLKNNILTEDGWVLGANEILTKLTTDPVLFDKYKEEAYLLSQKFTTSSLSIIWLKMLN